MRAVQCNGVKSSRLTCDQIIGLLPIYHIDYNINKTLHLKLIGKNQKKTFEEMRNHI